MPEKAKFVLYTEDHGPPRYYWENMTYGELVTILELVKLELLERIRSGGVRGSFVKDIDDRIRGGGR